MAGPGNCLIGQFMHGGVAGVAGPIRHSWPVARFSPAILTQCTSRTTTPKSLVKFEEELIDA